MALFAVKNIQHYFLAKKIKNKHTLTSKFMVKIPQINSNKTRKEKYHVTYPEAHRRYCSRYHFGFVSSYLHFGNTLHSKNTHWSAY